MNADKLTQPLFDDIRRCLDNVATECRARGRDDSRFIRLMARMAALAEHDAQPAQAAQPVSAHILRAHAAGMQCAIDNAGISKEDWKDSADYTMAHIGEWKRLFSECADNLSQPVGVPDEDVRWLLEQLPHGELSHDFIKYERACDTCKRIKAIKARLAPQPPAQPSADAEDARTVEDDVRDFGEGYEVDCRRVHPSRVTCYIGTSDGIFRKYITAHNVTSAAGDASNG